MFLGSLFSLWHRMHRRWRYHRTQRIISALPNDILKDIGWPGAARGLESCEERPRLRKGGL